MAMLLGIDVGTGGTRAVVIDQRGEIGFSREQSATLLAHNFDKRTMMQKQLQYERLDQLTIDLLLGVR